MKSLLITLIALWSTPVYSQATRGDHFEHVLVPIVTNGVVEGAFGSRWRGEIWVRNDALIPVLLETGGLVCIGGPCRNIEASETKIIDGLFMPPAGRLFRLPLEAYESGYTNDVITIEARIFELSRYAQPNGVEIPVVYEDDLLTSGVWLLGVRPSVANRIAVRAWDAAHATDAAVRVQAFDEADDKVIDVVMPLNPTARDEFGETDVNIPLYAAINNLAASYPELLTHDVVHFRVEPLVDGMLFYAMVTITDNDTQHVTLVTPK